MTAFSKILVAARGAAALRTVRTARAMGYRTVAVFGASDPEAPHVTAADQAVAVDTIGEDVSVEAVLDAARRTGADAVHPARGRAARNHVLATECHKARLAFIGPPPETIRLADDNRLARLCARGAGIAVIPGYDDKDQSDSRLVAEARRLGYPVVIKPACGDSEGRLVQDEESLVRALATARGDEGGDRGLVVEALIPDARRIDVPIFADTHGNVVYLAEREHTVRTEGSTLVAETPSLAVDPELRERLGAAAVALAGAIDYVGAGTIQFLLDAEGRYYFLDMLPELSLGHAMTEMVSGIDLVAWQIKVAAGEPLPLAQYAIPIAGHAMAARLHMTKDDDRRLLAWEPPGGAGIRADHAVDPGRAIGRVPGEPLADFAAYGTSREEARRRLSAAVAHCVVLGAATNRDRLEELLEDEALADGAPSDRIGRGPSAMEDLPSAAHISLAAILLAGEAVAEIAIASGGNRWQIAVERDAETYRVSASGRSRSITLLARNDTLLRVSCDGIVEPAHASLDGRTLHLDYRGRIRSYRREG
ncbi:MAG: 3-methylcrotonyl-CoA carboxylase [Rhodospirillaceae bacterium]|nr:3-methylcrotonyl-CoA carboxylase [Rhodospirillaceae bacterium]